MAKTQIMKPIILNPEESLLLEYQQEGWHYIVTFEDFKSIKEQQQVFESNAVGYERTKSL